MRLSAMGYDLSLSKNQGQQQEQKQMTSDDVSRSEIRKAIERLKEFKIGKASLENRIIENEKWFKTQHWDVIRTKAKDNSEPEPTTAYLFNMIANKHADAMDNYPEANMLPRKKSDKDEAKILSDIIPIVVDRSEFRLTYDDAWWYKLKHGCSAYGTFWNPDLENGLGDIDIFRVNLLNLFWQPGIENIQDSSDVFVLDLVDNDLLRSQYKDKNILPDDFSGSKIIEISQLILDDIVVTKDKSVVVDWYKKTIINGKTVVHLTKFVDEYKLASTKDHPDTAETGLYLHGEYPIDLDVLFPMDGTPVGFGYIDIVKNPQMYIDKLDQIITRNAALAGKQRFIVKDNGSIDPKTVLDYSQDMILVQGNVDEEHIRIFQANPLPNFIIEHRKNKIEEMKDTAGASDFSRGQAGGGVTAYAAIQALQEAGNKLSRDMIGRSYITFAKIIYKTMALIEQYYTDERDFRVEGKNNGDEQYVSYDNSGMQEQQIPPQWQGAGLIPHPDNPKIQVPSQIDQATGQQIPDPNFKPQFRKPIFDIKVRAEKQSPFSKMAQNEMSKEMFNLGFFSPQRAVEAVIALEMMQFEGKELVMQKVQENGNMQQQMQQMQQQFQMQMQGYQNQMQQMAAIIQKLTGQDMGQTDSILAEQKQKERLALANGGNQLQA